jgi:hypothetical protein
MKHGYLYESRPDLFPEGYLTLTEILLWQLYLDDKKQRLEAKHGGSTKNS